MSEVAVTDTPDEGTIAHRDSGGVAADVLPAEIGSGVSTAMSGTVVRAEMPRVWGGCPPPDYRPLRCGRDGTRLRTHARPEPV